MADPIWIDANVAIKASSGNKAYEAALIRLRQAGHRLLMPPRAFHEFMYGNQLTEGLKFKKGQPVPTSMQRPSPATRAARQIWASNMRISVDQLPENPSLAQRVASMEGAGGSHNASPSDAIVLGEVRTGAAIKNVQNPILLTDDAGPLQQAEHYGITARPPVPASSATPAAAPGATVSAPAAKTAASTGPTPKSASSAAPPVEEPPATVPMPKSGTPSARVPAQTTTTASLPEVPTIPFRTRLLAGARIVGGTAVTMLLMLIATWLRNQLAEIVIKGEIHLLEPVIRAEVEKRAEEVAHLQVNGSKAYANVTIGILQAYAGGVAQGMPKVSLDGIAITANSVNQVGSTPGPPGPMWTLPWLQRTEHTYSFELKIFSDEELETLASLTDLYLVYSRNLRTNPTSTHLTQQVKILRDKIVDQFGPKVWALQVGANP